MRCCLAVIAVIILQVGGLAPAAELTPPKAGKPEILPLKDVKLGMHAIAWTVFSGMTAEPVPVEIIGVWKNAMGPRQHVIMAKMGGKAERTGVAGGMSGSPVYVDGKLIGAVALRLSKRECIRCDMRHDTLGITGGPQRLTERQQEITLL
mgnify:CR=1 FL=1